MKSILAKTIKRKNDLFNVTLLGDKKKRKFENSMQNPLHFALN